MTRDTDHVPHRKNAAEWVMWAALLPLLPLAWLLERVRITGRPQPRREEARHG